MLHFRIGYWPYPQVFNLAEKAYQGQTLAYFENLLITALKSYVKFAMLSNILFSWKNLTVTNTLAYLGTKKKVFNIDNRFALTKVSHISITF